MPAALPAQDKISQQTTSQTTYKVITSQYGNGYSQRTADGINNNQATVSVIWDNVSLTDFTTIVTALDAAYGVDYFTWQQPGDAASKKWIVSQYSRSILSNNVFSVSASLAQVFDL
jgi:phage-related protein